MIDDINKDLDGKNLKRVRPPLVIQVRTQRHRVISYATLALLSMAVTIHAHIYDHPIWPRQVFGGFFLLLGIFGTYADYGIYKYQSTKLAVVDERLKDQAK